MDHRRGRSTAIGDGTGERRVELSVRASYLMEDDIDAQCNGLDRPVDRVPSRQLSRREHLWRAIDERTDVADLPSPMPRTASMRPIALRPGKAWRGQQRAGGRILALPQFGAAVRTTRVSRSRRSRRIAAKLSLGGGKQAAAIGLQPQRIMRSAIEHSASPSSERQCSASAVTVQPFRSRLFKKRAASPQPGRTSGARAGGDRQPGLGCPTRSPSAAA